MSGPIENIFAIILATPDWPQAARILAVDACIRNVADVLMRRQAKQEAGRLSALAGAGAIIVFDPPKPSTNPATSAAADTPPVPAGAVGTNPAAASAGAAAATTNNSSS